MIDSNLLEKIELFPRAVANDVHAAEKFCSRKIIENSKFGDIPFNDDWWSCGPQNDRTWLWILHSFLPLDPLIATGKINVLKKLVSSWRSKFEFASIEDDFPWHDHATAMRLDRLSRMALQLSNCRYTDLAVRHANLLLAEHFYTKNTNHGFDQALSLILASFAFPECDDAERWRVVGAVRLQREIRFAFTAEGVHVENSPAYHMGMVKNMLRARQVLRAAGIDVDSYDALLDKALRFLAWITRPDRFIAYLGDSASYRPSVPSQLAHMPSAPLVNWVATGGAQGAPTQELSTVYEQSGYAIYRSSWENWAEHTHIVMKCGFLSSYHRHDDDLNILVYAFGEDWLIDSGLYNHNHSDPIRMYMRSLLAHNVPWLPGVTATRKQSEPAIAFASLSPLQAEGCVFGVTGVTRMYRGGLVRRSLLVRDEAYFVIADCFAGFEGKPRYWLFHVPLNKKISLGRARATVTGKLRKLTIRASIDDMECNTYQGKDAVFPSVTSCVTNVFEDSIVIVFGPSCEDVVEFHFSFDDK
jgi:hypothetical protein